MNFSGSVLLSLALSIDALGIGASCSLKGIRMPFLSRLTIALVSGALTAFAVFFGGLLGGAVTEHTAKTAGGILIIMLGLYVLIGAIREERSSPGQEEENAVKKTARILTKPETGDMNSSKRIELREAVFMGAAVSADSFAAGFGLGSRDWSVPIFCAFFQLIFLCGGIYIGRRAKNAGNVREVWFGIASGVILIAVGAMRLAQ